LNIIRILDEEERREHERIGIEITDVPPRISSYRAKEDRGR
jgi:hypothetical protein